MEAIKGFEGFFTNPVFLALYGIIAWEVLFWGFDKDHRQKEGKRGSDLRYWALRWDNILVTIIFAPIVIYNAEGVHSIVISILDFFFDIPEVVPFYQFEYSMTGVLVAGIYEFMKWIRFWLLRIKKVKDV